ncbi:MAG: hypothetical protein L0H19_00795 [Salinisphaera sp.]|nr:hypothetical protein [Salinisphaera sp.]
MAKAKSGLLSSLWVLFRVVATVYALLALVVAIAVPVVLYFALFAGPSITVENDVALVWAPVGALTEQVNQDVPSALIGELLPGGVHNSAVRRLVQALDRAAGDPRIKLAFLKLGQLGYAQPGQLEDLVAAIERFRESGKPVIAWSPR